MAKTKITAIRGMNDILPDESLYWQYLEQVFRRIVESYGYAEIRTPIVESSELFHRTIGEATDVVEKETYTFTDRNGDSLTMRPEGTAGTVRAGIEHSLFYNQVQRLWYIGPIFRHERPQKGRYRQFHQIGVEAFGMAGPDIDLELLLLTWRLWQQLGLAKQVTLQLNSLGTVAERQRYTEQLVQYFSAHREHLDEDSLRRLTKNPLRILDSKNPAMQDLLRTAPSIQEHLGSASRAMFDTITTGLTQAGIPYQINPRLVRGLDYYCHTVFEWVSDELGAQGTVCAGGRYDGLVAQIGGDEVPAVGFAMGVERLLLLLRQQGLALTAAPDVYLISDETGRNHALMLAEIIRTALPHLALINHCGAGGFKAQMKKADKSGAKLALILGADELQKNTITLKYLREACEQELIQQAAVVAKLKTIFIEE